MLATMEEITMMYRPQTSSLLRSNSSSSNSTAIATTTTTTTTTISSSKRISNCSKSRISSSLSDCSSLFPIISRRCTSNRTKISSSGNTHSSIYPRCMTTTMAGTNSVSSSSCPVLLSVLAWSVTLLLISSCLGIADAGVLMGHPLGKRSFMQLQCKGIYDKSIFARLDRICEDCYNLFREPTLHTLCRKNCFTSDYFKGCLDVLLLQDEVEQIQTWIKQLHGADPGV